MVRMWEQYSGPEDGAKGSVRVMLALQNRYKHQEVREDKDVELCCG